ncbi:MAG: cation-translocating P-type ATPase [Lachnospiraceae bacterium]|nr:cation-translocating P-type ATPase [Lachnospiraceae bacterium]
MKERSKKGDPAARTHRLLRAAGAGILTALLLLFALFSGTGGPLASLAAGRAGAVTAVVLAGAVFLLTLPEWLRGLAVLAKGRSLPETLLCLAAPAVLLWAVIRAFAGQETAVHAAAAALALCEALILRALSDRFRPQIAVALRSNPAPEERAAVRLAGILPLVTAVSAVLGGLAAGVLRRSAGEGFCVFSAALMTAAPAALSPAIPLFVRRRNTGTDGIAVRDGRTLSHLAKTDLIVWEREGGLTENLPLVSRIEAFHGQGKARVMIYGASLAYGSPAPFAHAVVRFTERNGFGWQHDLIRPEAAPEEEENGIRAVLNRREAALGTVPWLSERYPLLPDDPELMKAVREAAGEGLMPLCVTLDGKALGLFCLEDDLRPEARQAVQELLRQRREMRLFSAAPTAAAVHTADRLGMPRAWAAGDLLPDEKGDAIRRLQNSERNVMIIRSYDSPKVSLRPPGTDAAAAAGEEAVETLPPGRGDILEADGRLGRFPALLKKAGHTVFLLRVLLAGVLLYHLAGLFWALGGSFLLAGKAPEPLAAAAFSTGITLLAFAVACAAGDRTRD